MGATTAPTPGHGTRSSPARLAATETNIAYRTADHERWQQLDFIVGIEVRLSNNHTCLGKDGKPHPFHDICDELKGKYPKDFKFTGWHPHCRCIATTILKTDAEMDADDEAILRGDEPSDPDTSENAVTELPENFRGWMETNQDRIARAKSLPYFIRDNEGLISRSGQVDYSGGHKMGGHKMMGRAEERIATKAYSEPRNNVQPVMSAEQIENRNQLAEMVGIPPSEIKPNMTHDEADGGYPNEYKDRDNCALTVLAYEARRRGLDVTALPFSAKDEDSWIFKIGDDLSASWINPSKAIPLKSVDGRLLQKSVDDATRAVGRYHLEWDKKTPQKFEGETQEIGHIIVAERLKDGTLVMHCTQWDEYYGLGSFEDAKDGTFKIWRVDNLLFNLEVVSQLLRRR